MILTSSIGTNTQYQDMVLGVMAMCRKTRCQLAVECDLPRSTITRFLAGKGISHLSFLTILNKVKEWEEMRKNLDE